MQNMDEVRENLTSVFNGLKDGSIKHHDACEMNNACGKIINSVKIQLEYYAMLKEIPPRIPFLERDGKVPVIEDKDKEDKDKKKK